MVVPVQYRCPTRAKHMLETDLQGAKMKTALKFFMDEVGKATREGSVIHSVEVEELDTREVQIMAMSEDDSVLAVATLEPQEGTLAEIEEVATVLASVAVGCSQALAECQLT